VDYQPPSAIMFWYNTLENYPITEDKIKLSQGFKNGFRLEYKGPRISITTKNLKSAVENKFITREKNTKIG
jgi:hypothetical protein